MAEAPATASERDPVIRPGASMNLASRFRRPGRKAIRATAMIVAAAVLLDFAILAAWWIFTQWRQGRVVLTNDGPPLKVQVLGESGEEPIGEPVDVIARSTIALPDGDYRLQVTGAGRLSRTYRFAVNRGETLAHSLTLDEGRLMGEEPTQGLGTRDARRKPPTPYAPNTVAIELATGKADLIKWTDHSIVRFDGVTGQVVWDALAVPKPGKPPRVYHPWLLWFAGRSTWARLVRPAPDLDGDGTRDLVWTFQVDPAFLALSGKDGSVLWTYLPELDGPGGAYPAGPALPGPIQPATRPMQTIDAPTLADLDRDGVPDLIATLLFQEFPAEILARRPELAKDRTAQVRDPLDASSRRSRADRESRSGATRSTPHSRRSASGSGTSQRRPCKAGRPRSWRSSTARSGGASTRRRAGRDLARSTWASSRCALSSTPTSTATASPKSSLSDRDRLASPSRSRRSRSRPAGSLWAVTVNAAYETPYDNTTAAPWPLVVDLDGDGRSEIVVPDTGALDPKNGYRGVRMLDGSSGPATLDPPDATRHEGRRRACTHRRRPGPGSRWRSRPRDDLDLHRPPAREFLSGRPRRARARLCRCALRQGRAAALVVARGDSDGPVHVRRNTPMVGTRGRTAGRSWPYRSAGGIRNSAT